MSNQSWETNSGGDNTLLASSDGDAYKDSSEIDKSSEQNNKFPVISDEWKKSVSLLTISFLWFILGLIFYTLSVSFFATLGVVGFGACGVLYLIFKFGAGYYIYQDAKKICVHSGEEDTVLDKKHRFVWEPRAWYWAGGMVVSPPFVELAPLAVYLSRRRDILGNP